MSTKMPNSFAGDLKEISSTYFKKNQPSMMIAENHIGCGIQVQKQVKKLYLFNRHTVDRWNWCSIN